MIIRKFEKLRKLSFWILDRLKGSPIRSNLDDIEFLLNYKSSKDIKDRQTANITNILNHAIKTVPFYKEINNLNNLVDFPVVNKTIIKNCYSKFFSDAFRKDELVSIITSGSTGTPFEVFQDKKKRNRNLADTIFFSSLAGYEIGYKLLYFKIWVKEKMKPKLFYWIQNLKPIDVIHLDDPKLSYILSKIEKSSSSISILGYASALELICKYLDANSIAPIIAKVKSIIAISESLNEYTKISMQKYFGVPTISRYSNLENGILGQQLIDEKRFLVNTASYKLELLKFDSDKHVEEGELGRIVVTDLFNYAFPLIRYDTGDVGIYEIDNTNGKFYLSQIEGRKLDLLYDTKGELVSSFIVYKNMWQYTEIQQYQLIQEGEKHYIIKINTSGSFKREKKLIQEFKYYLGSDAIIDVHYVNEIPLLSSGKRRKIVNMFYS